MPSSHREPGLYESYRARAILGVVIALTITSTLSLILRLIAKRIQRLKIAAEDWTIIAAQIAVYGMSACAILETIIGGAGDHAQDVPTKVPQFLKVLIALQVFYATTLALIKTSICLFYNRVFPLHKFRIFSYAVIACIVAWAVGIIFTAFFLCRPFAFNWNPTIPGGKCANQPVTYIVIGVLDLVIDLMILALPLPMIWGLQMRLANKVVLFAIFGVGIVTMVIGALRIHALLAVSFMDITYTSAYPVLWSFSEPAIGISVACAPLMRPLVMRGPLRRLFKQESTYARETYARGKSTTTSSFRRIEEHTYPLNNVTPGVTTITAGKASESFDAGSGSDEESGDTWPITQQVEARSPGITVKTEWQLEHH
ncbi:hypothetical protein EJ04DRAFT_578274 [Polyplosphaeria fusca]|uniref:Rhodopsin domain-containing protein n=1 Tax=Polyplosphaeria fusca TaxID=682080 RepID=A0A9P4QWU8_9PLEO|nr:hypothetical protein EJ04DRAFT_578274 [Polyplosphaeria fusca]